MHAPGKRINVGIGFVTGRKNFRNMVRTYVNNWNEHGLIQDLAVRLHLLVAYDLTYSGTRPSDYRLDPSLCDMVESLDFIGNSTIASEVRELIEHGVVDRREARLVFGDGYGKKRNVIVYFALKKGLDYLLFLDDDEYPVAVVKTGSQGIAWRGQSVLATHLHHIPTADLTHGHHCGYVSPIPCLEFDDVLSEEDFRRFITAISNDIINWESIKSKMQEGGVTYADNRLIDEQRVTEVEEINHAKFISGSNLCLNLAAMDDIPPFYNPPGARGEDTFMSTCLSTSRVKKVPCYTFHDGFLAYPHLLHGVLPRRLKPVKAETRRVVARFLKAAIGWVRYKPLLLYVTRRSRYRSTVEQMRSDLRRVVPGFCRYFDTPDFQKILAELDRYDRLVEQHFQAFEETKQVWRRIVSFVRAERRRAGEASASAPCGPKSVAAGK